LDPSSASLTGDGYAIDKSPYMLTFIVDDSVGYFSSFSAVFTPTSGYDPSKIFFPCNIVTNPRGSGLGNYLTYIVMNGVAANGQSNTETFTCRVTFNQYGPQGATTPIVRAMNSGSIKNEPV
jgi:hypothetical protein